MSHQSPCSRFPSRAPPFLRLRSERRTKYQTPWREGWLPIGREQGEKSGIGIDRHQMVTEPHERIALREGPPSNTDGFFEDGLLGQRNKFTTFSNHNSWNGVS